jgi:hypothetical protein
VTGPAVKDSLLVEYRCRAKGCVLLRVWQTPPGPQFIAPGHRLSDRWTRIRHLAKRLSVGGTEWPDDGGRLHDEQGLVLVCNHVTDYVLTYKIRRDIDGATPGRPMRVLWPPDMSTPS